MTVYAPALSTSSSFRVFAGDSDVRGGALIPFDLLDEEDKYHVDLNYSVHKGLLSRASSTEFEPIAYVDWRHRVVALNPQSYQFKKVGLETNTSDSPPEWAAQRYSEIAKILDDLREPAVLEDEMDKGAVETAASVVRQLNAFHYPPPEISWHGGDAVVMLWALGKTTYAITVTDGEIGYVVRRDNKTIKRGDSVLINAFTIEKILE